MIVFAAHVPHSPLLMPSISGDRIGAVKKTTDALSELAEELAAVHPDTILLLSDHPTMFSDAFSVSVADPYVCSLQDVGDLGYRKTYRPDLSVIDRVQRDLRKSGEPLTLSTDAELHFAAAVPLHFLSTHLPDVSIVPIAPCMLSPKAHFSFGQALKHTLVASEKRIAIISAGDTSQTLTDFAPGGYHEEGERYDSALRTLLTHNNAVGLLQLDDELVAAAQESSYRKLLMLFGALDGMHTTATIMSDEAPFGVGYLVVHFSL